MFTAVEIEINHDCNQQCSYCPNSVAKRKEQGHMSIDLFTKILGQLKDINFTGRVSYEFYNEPLLHEGLEIFIKLTREYLPKCKIVLYTNGTLLSKNKLFKLIEIGVDHFNVTKHDVSKNYIFEDVYAQLKPEDKLRVTYLTPKNIYITNRGGILKNIGNEIPSSLVPCYIPSYVLVITVKGNVLPCYDDFYQQNAMGNVFSEHILTIWNSDRYREFRTSLKRCQRHLYATCINCNRVSRNTKNLYMN